MKIGLIPDGNRRWASKNNLSKRRGHEEGAKNLEMFLREILTNNEIDYIVIYALSHDNYEGRSNEEINNILDLESMKFLELLNSKKIYENEVRVTFTGDFENFNGKIQETIDKLVEKTMNHDKKVLNFLFNYDTTKIYEYDYTGFKIPDIDFLIRTGCKDKGIKLSGFLPYQCRYSELYFEEKYFPETNINDLKKWIHHFSKRNRTFGR